MSRIGLVTLAVGTWCAAWGAGCGGNAPPPQAPAAPAPVAQAPAPPPDLSAVPDPPMLILTGRASKLGASLSVVHGWSKLPMPQSEQLSELLTSEAVGPLVDLDQPVDFAVAIDGVAARMQVVAALSAAVKDPDKAKASLAERYKLVPGDNGTTLIKGLGRPVHKSNDDDEDEDSDGKPDAPDDDGDESNSARVCELAPAFGDAPVRIVCGLSAKGLTALAPWLTRTATRTSAGADLHVEAHLEPLRSTLVAQKRLAGAILSGLIGGALRGPTGRDLIGNVGADLADLASDLDGVAVDLSVTDPGAQASVTLKISGKASSLGQLLTAHAERGGSPPAAFWQLPGDSDFAFFERGVDDAPVSRARDLLLDSIAQGLVEHNVKDADINAIKTALGKLVTGAAVAYGSGLDVAALRKSVAAEKALGPDADPAKLVAARHDTGEGLLGWHVLQIDQPPAMVAAELKDIAAAIDRPAVLAAMRSKDKDALPPTLRPAPLAAGKTSGLPAGAGHWVLELASSTRAVAGAEGATDSKKRPPAPKRLVMHVIIVPDAAHTWVGFGGDEAALTAKLAGSLAATGDHLSGHADLAALKDTKVGAAGFLTARSLPETLLEMQVGASGVTTGVNMALDDLDQMPNKGMSPLVFSATAQSGGPPSTVVLSLNVPRGSIEDLVVEVLRHGGF